MTVKQIFDKLETFDKSDRAKYVGALWKQLCPVSKSTLLDFQQGFDSKKGMEEFFKEQARQIKNCIQLEIGQMGNTVRKIMGLEPLTWETEIAA